MGEEAVKTVIPESVLKKRKREEEWALAKKQDLEATKKKNAENRKLIFNRAKLYSKEYEQQVRINHDYWLLCFDDSLNYWFFIYLGLFRRRSWLGWSVRQSWKVGFMLTQRRSSCLSFAFVGKFFPVLIFPLHEIFMVDHQFLIFFFLGIWNLTVSMPCTQRLERSCSSCVWDRYYMKLCFCV